MGSRTPKAFPVERVRTGKVRCLLEEELVMEDTTASSRVARCVCRGRLERAAQQQYQLRDTQNNGMPPIAGRKRPLE